MNIVDSIKTLNERKLLMRRVLEIAIFGALYFALFTLLEKVNATDVFILHNRLDEIIPFVPGFIIPYVLWFPYMGISVAWFALLDTEGPDYWRMTRSLAFGCVVFLIISWVFPNGQDLRPDVANLGNSVFESIIKSLYSGDTSTNVFPSLHCYNSIAACEAWCHSKMLKGHPVIKALIIILSVSICLSTMFCKQHSSYDVFGAIILFGICYLLMFIRDKKMAKQ